MGQKRFKAEQIIRMLREAEVELSRGQTVVQWAVNLALRIKLIIDGVKSMAV